MSASSLDTHLEQLKSKIDGINDQFIRKLNQELNDSFSLLENLHSNLISMAGMSSGLNEGKERDDRIVKFHSQNLVLLEKKYTSLHSEAFLDGIIKEVGLELEQYLEAIPELIPVEYPRESLTARKDDPFRVKAGLYLAGRFDRSSKKTGNHSDGRILKVHFRKLVKGYLFPQYFDTLGTLVKESQDRLIEIYAALFEAGNVFLKNDYSIQTIELSNIIISSKDLHAARPDAFFGLHREELGKLLMRSALVFSMNLWQNLGRSLDFNKSRDGLAKASRSWQCTFFALFEDWRLHEQLFAYLHEVQLASLQVENIFSKRINSSLYPEVEKQLGYTSKLLQRLPDPDNADMEAIRTFFVSELYRLKKEKINEEQKGQLRQAGEDIPKLLQKLENELIEHLDIFPEKAGVVSNPKYRTGIKPSEIYYFSPAEFIAFEYLNNLRSVLAQHRASLGKELQVIISEFNEYDQIIDFYLDSTISLTEKAGMTESEVIQFFREGLNRLLNISNRIADLLKGLNKEKLAEVTLLVNNFQDQVAELDNNDNIIVLYTRLLKSKALAESKSRREKLADFTRRTWTEGGHLLSRQSKWFQTSYSDIKKRLRIDTSSAPISSDISNYLIEIQKRIYKLPLIYQHLFENVPIREFNLFLSRENEITQLNQAYDDWLKDNFAASLVVGENGSGKSSLLHYYSQTLKTNYKVLLHQVAGYSHTEDDFYHLLRKLFDNDGLTDDQSITRHIDSLPEPRIIIIDGLERLFLRKVNGFICLQKLLSLIVSTNHQIFWICSVSKYASAYLNKTLGLSEYFDYSIGIDTLNSRQIRDIVLKRNRLSGYGLSYQIEPGTEGNSKTKNLTQSELEDRFFAALNEFAGSNISLSLNYWLQSIHSIQDDQIMIRNFQAPDFGFLESISPEKAYTLLVVVMHGRITLEQHALIFSQRVERSYKVLSILKEDSILVKQNEYYTLNSILFRNVVKMLENRNLIH